MASDRARSILQSQNPDDLKHFKWDTLLCELSTYAPLLRKLLELATKTKRPQVNLKAVIGVCAAILINHRNSKMNLIQKITSLILYAGHASKQVCTNHEYYESLFTLSPGYQSFFKKKKKRRGAVANRIGNGLIRLATR